MTAWCGLSLAQGSLATVPSSGLHGTAQRTEQCLAVLAIAAASYH